MLKFKVTKSNGRSREDLDTIGKSSANPDKDKKDCVSVLSKDSDLGSLSTDNDVPECSKSIRSDQSSICSGFRKTESFEDSTYTMESSQSSSSGIASDHPDSHSLSSHGNQESYDEQEFFHQRLQCKHQRPLRNQKAVQSRRSPGSQSSGSSFGRNLKGRLPIRRTASSNRAANQNEDDSDNEYTSGMVEGSHDVSRDSSSGIESGEAAHSDNSPNTSQKHVGGHQVQHRVQIHKEGVPTYRQQQQHNFIHNRDPSWSSQTCSDSDVMHGGSLFSSSDTDNNARPVTPTANARPKTPTGNSRPKTPVVNGRPKTPVNSSGRPKTPVHNGHLKTSLNNTRPKTPISHIERKSAAALSNGDYKAVSSQDKLLPVDNGVRTRVKGRAAMKCKKHVTFQSPVPGSMHQQDCQNNTAPIENETTIINGRKDNDHFRKSDILYYEDNDEEYRSNQYYNTPYQETDLDNPNDTGAMGSVLTPMYTQGNHHATVSQSSTRQNNLHYNHNHHVQQSTTTTRAKSPYSFDHSRPQTQVSNVSAISSSDHRLNGVMQQHKLLPTTGESSNNSSYLDILPDDIIIRIFSHLSTDQLCRCSAVCRKWYDLSWDPTLWTTIKINNPLANIDKALKHLTRRLSYNTPGVCILVEKIVLNGCEQLTDKGVFTIAKRCAELRHLEIQGCTNVSNIAIFEVVSRCVNLEHLNVTGCEQVTCISLTPQATVQAQTYGKQVDLRYLDMSDCFNLEDAGLQIIASYCSQLVYLYLRRCSKVTDIGVQYVANYCHDLKELSISDCNRLTDFGMKEIAKLGSKLRYLSVAKCERVTDIGVKSIAKYCHRIRYLNVRGCEGVTDESVDALSRQCQRLRSLDVGKCDITDEGLQVLADNSPQLKKLSLKSCDAITDKGIMYIANKCRLLQQLNIQECHVTVAAYRTVKSLCKNCIIEHTNPGFY